jgi:hypothetical protein
MNKCSVNVKKIAKKYLEKNNSLTDLERVCLLYTYYTELLEDIDQDIETDVELEDEIIEQWVVNLFMPPEVDIDLELAAMSIIGSDSIH